MIEQQIKALILDKGQGRALWHLGALMTFKALGSETGGKLWALEGYADKQMAVPLHVHAQEDEFWFVLEGKLRFIIGDEERTGGAGAFAYIPHGTPHTFQVVSETARWLGVGTPAILDQWFFETGEPAPALTLPPPFEPTPASIDALIASLKPYGTEIVGPPPSAG